MNNSEWVQCSRARAFGRCRAGSGDLARFVTHLRRDVIAAAKTNILDTLACGLAEVAGLVRGWGGAAQADLFVLGGQYPAHHAFINRGMCHARDYDDTHDAVILHAGVTTG